MERNVVILDVDYVIENDGNSTLEELAKKIYQLYIKDFTVLSKKFIVLSGTKSLMKLNNLSPSLVK